MNIEKRKIRILKNSKNRKVYEEYLVSIPKSWVKGWCKTVVLVKDEGMISIKPLEVVMLDE